LDVVAHLVALLSFEDEVVETYSPLFDFFFKSQLESLFTSSVPHLEQEVAAFIKLLNAVVYFHLYWHKKHVFVVRAGAVHRVQRLKVDFIGAVFQILISITGFFSNVRHVVRLFE
jgi:hypothetical protein